MVGRIVVQLEFRQDWCAPRHVINTPVLLFSHLLQPFANYTLRNILTLCNLDFSLYSVALPIWETQSNMTSKRGLGEISVFARFSPGKNPRDLKQVYIAAYKFPIT